MPMKVMGVDASSSCTGIVIIENGDLIESDIWQPTNKKALASDRLFEYSQWIKGKLYTHRPDLCAVSSTSFSRNAHTTRVLARYEGVTVAAARLYSCDVVDVRDSTARKMVLSKGNLSKQDSYNEVLKKEPNYAWLPFKSGGNDQTDAYCIARAAPFLEYS